MNLRRSIILKLGGLLSLNLIPGATLGSELAHSFYADSITEYVELGKKSDRRTFTYEYIEKRKGDYQRFTKNQNTSFFETVFNEYKNSGKIVSFDKSQENNRYISSIKFDSHKSLYSFLKEANMGDKSRRNERVLLDLHLRVTIS